MGKNGNFNRPRLTPGSRKKFLELLEKSANVRGSARALNLSTSNLYKERERDPKFAHEWDEACEFAIDALEEEARRRAFEGYDKPVFYKGNLCGSIREYSDSLLMFLLNGLRSSKFKYRSEITGNVGVTVQVVKFAGEGLKQVVDVASKDTKQLAASIRSATPLVLLGTGGEAGGGGGSSEMG